MQVIALLRSTRIDTNLVAHVKALVRGAYFLATETYVALEDYVVLSLCTVCIGASGTARLLLGTRGSEE